MTKNEMAAFFCRWIEGGGCPRLTVGYTFRKSRRQELLFAIELDGCAAAAAADRAAFRKNAKISVTVRVQEADLPPSDHAVSLSAHDRAYCLMPLQLVTKPRTGAPSPGSSRRRWTASSAPSRRAGQPQPGRGGGGEVSKGARSARTPRASGWRRSACLPRSTGSRA